MAPSCTGFLHLYPMVQGLRIILDQLNHIVYWTAFFMRHAHYQNGNTPLALGWKDENCSQYVIDTDSRGQVPLHQQVVLELQDDGQLATSDDPPVSLGCLNSDFIEKTGLRCGDLLRFAISGEGLKFVDGKLEKADLKYLVKANHSRAFADSYSKVMFQYTVRHSALRIGHLFASINSSNDHANAPSDVEIIG